MTLKLLGITLNNKIPIGILHKVNKGQNRILGLGMIVSERDDGVFIIEPYSFLNTENDVDDSHDEMNDIETDIKYQPKNSYMVVKQAFSSGEGKKELDVSIPELINHIDQYIASKGYYFQKEEIVNSISIYQNKTIRHPFRHL